MNEAAHLNGGQGKRTVFDYLEKVIDFHWVERYLAEALPLSSWSGERPFHPMVLWKISLLRNWYDLSETRILEEIRDRKSLERFVGDEIWDPRLNEDVLTEFENVLVKANVFEQILFEVDDRIYISGFGRTRGYAVDPQLVRPGGKPCVLEELE
jgi:hypothetical protein